VFEFNEDARLHTPRCCLIIAVGTLRLVAWGSAMANNKHQEALHTAVFAETRLLLCLRCVCTAAVLLSAVACCCL
jgi:hypothetical protein